MKATVAERGQITIPHQVREQLGIRPGTILDIQVRGHTLIATKTTSQSPLDEVYGCLGKGLDTDQMMRELRGEENDYNDR